MFTCFADGLKYSVGMKLSLEAGRECENMVKLGGEKCSKFSCWPYRSVKNNSVLHTILKWTFYIMLIVAITIVDFKKKCKYSNRMQFAPYMALRLSHSVMFFWFHF
jgi:hypothetical protein